MSKGGNRAVIAYLFFVGAANMALGFGVAWQLGRLSRRNQAFAASEPLGATGREHDDVSAEAAAEAASPPSTATSSQEGLLSRLDEAVQLYQNELATIDADLRICVDAPESGKISFCLESLTEANQGYLSAQRQTQADLAALGGDASADASFPKIAPIAVMEERLEATRQLVESFDFEGDLGAGCREILAGTASVQRACHELHGSIESLLTVADNPPPAAADAPPLPPQKAAAAVVERPAPPVAATSTATDRNALRSSFDEWRQQRKPDTVALVLLNSDGFSLVNDRYGRPCGDRVLASIANWLATACPASCQLTHYEDSFALMLPGQERHETILLVERIRQTVECTRFQHGQAEITLTVSVGLAAGAAGDDSDALLERAKAALTAAKDHGRNCCFEFVAGAPVPIAPAKLDVAERQALA